MKRCVGLSVRSYRQPHGSEVVIEREQLGDAPAACHGNADRVSQAERYVRVLLQNVPAKAFELTIDPHDPQPPALLGDPKDFAESERRLKTEVVAQSCRGLVDHVARREESGPVRGESLVVLSCHDVEPIVLVA